MASLMTELHALCWPVQERDWPGAGAGVPVGPGQGEAPAAAAALVSVKDVLFERNHLEEVRGSMK